MKDRMTKWTADELAKIGNSDELRIAFQRPDGTLAAPRTIWVVRDGDDLYVRSVRGRTSGWFRGVQASHQGHVEAGGVSKDVTACWPPWSTRALVTECGWTPERYQDWLAASVLAS